MRKLLIKFLKPLIKDILEETKPIIKDAIKESIKYQINKELGGR